jgi:hypothetical protein
VVAKRVTCLKGIITGTSPSETVLHAISFSQKCAVLRSVLKLSTTPFARTILKRVERTEQLMRVRDIAAHGMLVYEQNDFRLAQLTLPTILALKTSSDGIMRVRDLVEAAALSPSTWISRAFARQVAPAQQADDRRYDEGEFYHKKL